MESLPLAVHSGAQVRELDRHAIDVLGIPSYTLMTRAGEAAFAALRGCWPSAQRIAVVCGPGNNGGDGYVLARLARERRLQVDVLSLADPAKLTGDARRAHDDFVKAGGRVDRWASEQSLSADVIVDAIFGTGLARTVSAEHAHCIEAINSRGCPVFAIDIPSGLHSDTGEVLGAAVLADRTLAFLGLKLGFYLGAGPDHVGIVMFDALELPADALEAVPASARRLGANDVARALPPRRRTSHKGEQGRILVVGGNHGMAGAARMTGEAALRVGAGLVTVATRPENVAAIVAERPELMCRGIEQVDALRPLIERADILAIGPGLGQDEWAQAMLDAALGSGKPAVVDADALNLLAQTPRTGSNWILTPHPGEAGRLLGLGSAADVQRDRLGAARKLASQYRSIVVLKGAGTLVVADDALPAICDQGNPGMASPGMGDVLTGVIAGIAAQTSNLSDAARAGVLVHAMAGDMAARRGERGLLATDLFSYLPTCVNPLQRR
jgi:ADP-dependent NAD(P)H-hydrate dehydratase / NAD(P)H-hydrate epimerase